MKNINLFLKSLLNRGKPINNTEFALEWIRAQNEKIDVEIEEIPFSGLKNWSFRNEALRHDSGKFFSIDGIEVTTNAGEVGHWQQPIINQPEIGYLGFITKEFNGVLHFLMQAKIEPGNINYVQLSPTLQATKSNYSRVHKGNPPAYLDYFQKAKTDEIIIDQLQSEQGARFLKKRNRNIIIKVEDEIEVLENFIWLTLGQIKKLMRFDNLINMDTRTVIAGIPLGDFSLISLDVIKSISDINLTEYSEGLLRSSSNDSKSYNSFNDIIHFITKHKCNYELTVTKTPLNLLKDWVIGETSIYHRDGKYFEIIAANINIENREVINWSQPMVKPVQEGICAFICKNIDGVLHFIVQAKLECGNFDIIEFAPTVQCLTDNYRTEHSINGLPFLKEVLNAKPESIIFDTYQSEEGGRFYKEQNRSLIIFADPTFPIELPEHYIWMTFSQLQTFIKHNNYVNIQARSLISAITFDSE